VVGGQRSFGREEGMRSDGGAPRLKASRGLFRPRHNRRRRPRWPLGRGKKCARTTRCKHRA
jgi:hypothetical protein